MGPAQRESVRLVLDQSDTPADALGRKLIATSSCAYYPPERPEVDICPVCGLEGWGCTCEPCWNLRSHDGHRGPRLPFQAFTRAEFAAIEEDSE